MFKHFIKKRSFNKKKDKTNLSENELFQNFNKIRKTKYKSSFCFAADRNMYFRPNGSVTPCCHNHTCILGHMSDQSIKEVWGGARIRELRSQLVNYNLNEGCYRCYEQLASENYSAVQSLNYDELPYSKDKPVLMEFELSHDCNLNCIMCFNDKAKSKKELPSYYNEIFFSQLDEFLPGLKQAKFYGGEPFFIEAYFQIWERLIQVNPKCQIFVQTNGTILNERLKSILENGNFNISVSIEAVDKIIYEKIRQGASFEKVMENISWFLDYSKRKNTFFGISVCPIRENWGTLPEIVNYCNQLGIKIYFNIVREPLHHSLWILDNVSLGIIINYLKSYSFSVNDIISSDNQCQFNSLISLLESWKLFSIERERIESEIDGFSNEELKNMLINKILDFYRDNNMFDYNLNAQGIVNKIDSLLDKKDNTSNTKDILIKINSLPARYLAEVIKEEISVILNNMRFI